MKLQRQTSRKYGDKEYAKYAVVIPENLIKDLDWKPGQELKAKVTKNKLVIEKE